jgi:putative glutamine amidotransferase
MPPRPLIGVTTQTLHVIDGIPPSLPASWVMNQRYIRAVIAGGGAPVLIPLIADDPDALRAVYDRLDGLLVPGGVDLDPATYQTPPHPLLGSLDAARDAAELTLTGWALADHKPFLGLCRGLQVLNVIRGGSLWQDLAAEREGSIKHDFYPTAGWARDHLAHPVELRPDSRLGEALGPATVPVNSMHHQGVRDLGEGLVPTAWAPDGLIEAIELTDRFAVGVQWHPEMFPAGAPSVGQLFATFIDAAQAARPA